jgi:hypothetical protein
LKSSSRREVRLHSKQLFVPASVRG